MKYYLKNKKGFTLVELIIAIALLIIIIAGMSPLIIKSSKYMAEITARTKYQNAASNIINLIRLEVGNSNEVYIYNDTTPSSSDVSENDARFVNDDDYRSFYIETDGGKRPIISSEALDGKKIKVDYECSKDTGTTDSRLAMLYVTVSIYDTDQDLSYFDDNPNDVIYAKTKKVAIIKQDGTPGTKDVETGAPVPLYQQTSGIYLINTASNVGVPASRCERLTKGFEDKTLKLVKSYNEDGTVEEYYTNESAEEYAVKKENFYNTIKKNDAASAADLGLYAQDVEDYLKIADNETDYVGSVLKYAVVIG